MSTYPTFSGAGTRSAFRGFPKPHGPVYAADHTPPEITLRSARLSPLQALAVAHERFVWNRRAHNWDDEGSAGLTDVVAEVVRECRTSAPPGAVAVDLGAGSGQITIPLADRCSRILAVDVSARLLEGLEAKAARQGITNIACVIQAMETLDLAPASVDLVVSNYALHHMRDRDKEQLLRRCYTWLRPGGRIVVGDMMFGRGADPGDRAVIASKAGILLRRGPGGWWRLLKNVVRFSVRLGEKPIPPHRWAAMAHDAGFDGVTVNRLRAEAHLLKATKPHRDAIHAVAPLHRNAPSAL
jgi:SAM-dependent methyltransferase